MTGGGSFINLFSLVPISGIYNFIYFVKKISVAVGFLEFLSTTYEDLPKATYPINCPNNVAIQVCVYIYTTYTLDTRVVR